MGEDIVFKILSSRTSSVFVNREVLRPDYVPDILPHREREITKLTEILSPLLNGERPSNVFIYGLTGTGKTAVTKYVLKKFSEFKAKVGGKDFTFIYVNCRHDDTTYRALAKIAEGLGLRVPFTGLSTAEVYSRIKKALDKSNLPVVVILDEVDFLVKKQGDEILYRLTRINDELIRGKVSLVGITNDVRFVETLDPRVKSSLGEIEMVFPPYDADQLADILRDRAEVAFRPGALEEGVISYCASIAAREHGDARKALDLLRVAGEVADREGASKVTIEHVRKAREEIERDMIAEVIKTLPYHGKLLLLALSLLGGRATSTGELYSKYREVVSILGIEAVTQRRVSDIIGELDMLGILTSRVINRGRYGKTREIKLNVSAETAVKVLSEDPRIEWLIKKRRNR